MHAADYGLGAVGHERCLWWGDTRAGISALQPMRPGPGAKPCRIARHGSSPVRTAAEPVFGKKRSENSRLAMLRSMTCVP